MAGDTGFGFTTALIVLLPVLVAALYLRAAGPDKPQPLPAASTKGQVSLEETLTGRRSVRRFKSTALSPEQISQLCWAGQGISDKRRAFRTCPSAGALYPLELYVVTVEGVDHYNPQAHALTRHISGDVREKLQRASWNQSFVGDAPATFVVAAVVSRTQAKYGQRALRYVHMEVGHAGQNILLQAYALGLGSVPVGAFNDAQVAGVLSLPVGQVPLYLIPVGTPAD